MYYYLRFEEALIYWNRSMTGGRKSFRMDELDPQYFFKGQKGDLVPYLTMISKDLEERSKKG